MDLDTLRAEVDDAFVSTSEGLSPWPAPRELGDDPREEEYSRCLDPGKFRLIGARADAWVEVVVAHGWATVAEPRPLVTVVSPRREGALSLKLVRGAIEDVPDASLAVSVDRPAVDLAMLPTCGCDACDDGSATELEELDERIFHVMSGELVHVKGRRGEVTSMHDDGYEATGDVPEEEWIREARAGRVPPRTKVVRGGAWWD